jgi:simple sugar transport system permease protein
MTWLFDAELLHLSVAVMVPFVLAALGELVMERAGILNVSIEGMMALGASVGFLGAFFSGRALVGLLVAALAVSVMALVLAFFAITLRADQITVGLALLVLGVGLGSLLYRVLTGLRPAAPLVPTLPAIPLPGLSSLPGVGEILFQHDALAYLALLLIPFTYWLLFATTPGLRIRACGENPRAADSQGVPVNALRYATTIAGGALIGLAGAYLPLAITGGYTDGIVGGRGWIALMLVIFGRWQPGWVALGCLLFAYVEALQFKLTTLSRGIPSQLLLSLPYLLAIAGLVSVYRNARVPAALGLPFDREERA